VESSTQLSLLNVGKAGNSFESLCGALGVELVPGWPDWFGEALRLCLADSTREPIRTLSLFSGGGGLDIGFHDAAFDVVEMVEIDERFVKSLSYNVEEGRYLHPSSPVCIDISDYSADHLGKIDFIIGGPPCQSWSAAGRRANGVRGINDARGRLFEEYIRLLTKLQPTGFLFENVYGITGANGGRSWPLIVKAFEEAGYYLSYRVLDAADFGVPQHRERMIIVGSRNGRFRFPIPTHGPDSISGNFYYTAGDALPGVTSQEGELDLSIGGRFGHLLPEIPPGLNYSFFTAEMGHPRPVFSWRSKFSDFLYKADPSAPVRTIKAQGGQYTGPFHWDSRRFTIAELKRLQTFPDSYELLGGRGVVVHQLGNSVPPQMARILALAIRQQLFECDRMELGLPTLEEGASLGFRRRKRDRTRQYKLIASAALASSQATAIARPPLRPFRRRYRLGADLLLNRSRSGPWTVGFSPLQDEWVIRVDEVDQSKGSSDCEVSIQRTPGRLSWNLPVDALRLVLGTRSEEALLVAWRGLEDVLIQADYKSDLVQLAGYYQYAPSFRCSFETGDIEELPLIWRGLSLITEGIGVRRIIPSAELAVLWGVGPETLLPTLVAVKELGFEVRNTQTNPELPTGSFLIPYSFPTLTGASVQFNKPLD
jgi:DNA (cytosine-5)-methyltransferase 1